MTVLLTLAAGFVGANSAYAEPACPAAACITISGRVTGPMGEAVPNYNVGFQRDGYNAVVTTTAAGVYTAVVPVPPSNSCYQVFGHSDPYYAQVGGQQRFCTTSTVDLHPKVRINGVAGPQKVYLPDATTTTLVPVQVSALSRTYPAAFHGQPLPFKRDYQDPQTSEGGHRHGEDGEHMERGVFGPPEVRQIAAGVWQYLWSDVMTMQADHPGFYDMDWGRGTSVFDPMMECKMVWFGYGIDSPPQKAIPGGTVTFDGRRFGSQSGSLVLKGSGAVTTIQGNGIVSWTDTRIVFTVPPLAKTGWVTVIPPSKVESNAQHLNLDLARLPVA